MAAAIAVTLAGMMTIAVATVVSSSSVVLPSALHSYVKRRFSGPPFPPLSDSEELSLAF